MWVIFRDPKTMFNHVDKYVCEIVEDKDILAYQTKLYEQVGGRTHELNQSVFFLQQLVTTQDDVEYFARRYNVYHGV